MGQLQKVQGLFVQNNFQVFGGRIWLYQHKEDGRATCLGPLMRGDVFSKTEFEDCNLSLYAYPMAIVRPLALDQIKPSELFKTHLHLLNFATHQLYILHLTLRDSVPTSILYCLLYLRDLIGSSFIVSHQTIADICSTSRVTTTKTLTKLEEQGYVKVRDRRISVLTDLSIEDVMLQVSIDKHLFQ